MVGPHDHLKNQRIHSGGYKEATFEIKGKGVYKDLRFESGVHRIQRVPATEKSGRVHTPLHLLQSFQSEKIKITINPADIEMEFSRSGGAGVKTLIRLKLRFV